jgi:hypothetical protein
VALNITGFWDVTSCSLVGVYTGVSEERTLFEEQRRLLPAGLSLKMDEVRSSETPMNLCQTTRRQDVKIIHLAAVDAAGAVHRRTRTGLHQGYRNSRSQGLLYARCLCKSN